MRLSKPSQLLSLWLTAHVDNPDLVLPTWLFAKFKQCSGLLPFIRDPYGASACPHSTFIHSWVSPSCVNTTHAESQHPIPRSKGPLEFLQVVSKAGAAGMSFCQQFLCPKGDPFQSYLKQFNNRIPRPDIIIQFKFSDLRLLGKFDNLFYCFCNTFKTAAGSQMIQIYLHLLLCCLFILAFRVPVQCLKTLTNQKGASMHL